MSRRQPEGIYHTKSYFTFSRLAVGWVSIACIVVIVGRRPKLIRARDGERRDATRRDVRDCAGSTFLPLRIVIVVSERIAIYVCR